MASPAGAVGATFTVMRILQAVSLISMIGLTGHVVGELVTEGYRTPSALVGTLVVACSTAMYVAISYILYWDQMLPLLVAAAADVGCFVASTVVACVIGRPVSHLSCGRLPPKGSTGDLLSLFDGDSGNRGFDGSRGSCVELSALWGFSIAASIMFFVSATAAFSIWMRVRGRQASRAPYAKGIDCE